MQCLKARMIATTAGLLAAIAIAAIGTPASAATKILVHIFAPPAYPNNSAGWVFLKKNVERETQGRVTFQFTNGAVGPPRQNIQLVQDGAVDAAYLNTGLNRAQWRLPEIGRLPFLAPSGEAVSVANWRTYEKFFTKANEFKGVHLLSIYSSPGEQLWSVGKPMNKYADFSGMKMRTAAGQGADVVRAMGITPVPSLAAEVFPLVSKGVVDGVSGDAAFVKLVKVSKYLKYGVRFPGGLNALVFIAFMSDAKWKQISPQDQAIVNKYAGEAMARSVGKEWDRLNGIALKEMAANGTKIMPATPEMVAAAKKALAKFETQWIADAEKKGVDGKAALAYFRAQEEQIEKQRAAH